MIRLEYTIDGKAWNHISVDFKVVTKTTMPAKDTIEHEGKTLPYIKVDISSASHPFYTGNQKILDTEGRVDKFKKKFGSRDRGAKTTK